MLEKSTIYEVARRSGVSTATVSRVMRDGAGFSEATRRRVLDVAGELGWVPNGTARGLAERRVGIIGLLFPDLGKDEASENESPLFVDQVIRGAERSATLAGDAVLLAATEGDTGRSLALSVAGRVDGLVVTARSLSAPDLAAVARSVPVVVIDSGAARRKYDAVLADNADGAYQATRHLVDDHGYPDVEFVAGPPRSPDSMQRFQGFRKALAAYDRPVPEAPAGHGNFTEAGGHRAVERLLAGRRRPPRAIVFGNDEMAIGGLNALRRHKLRVPADVAVTGFDDIASARHVRPTLTTVRQPMRRLGEEAVRMLLERQRNPRQDRQGLVLPVSLQLRRSCGCK